MLIEAKFKYALKEMLQEKPLEDINVTSLCKKCNCHRQTFYYHYQDIYDLVDAIFLNEEIPQIDNANSLIGVLSCFTKYSDGNFLFLKSVYNSGAHELAEGFVFEKIIAKANSILCSGKYSCKPNVARSSARRFAKLVSDEVSYLFKDINLTTEFFSKEFSKFSKDVIDIVLPSIIELSKKESGND